MLKNATKGNNLMQHYFEQAMAPESQEFNQGVEKCRRTITNTLPPWAFQVKRLQRINLFRLSAYSKILDIF